MAVVTLKSAVITNLDAVPSVINNGRLEKGAIRSSIGFVGVTSGDSIGSKAILASVPSTAIVRDVLLSCGAITSGAADIGVYRTTRDGGAVVDVDLFASAQSIATALNKTNVINESGNNTIAKQNQPLWQAAGLTSDPGGELDIVATLTAAAAASADLGIDVKYCDGGN